MCFVLRVEFHVARMQPKILPKFPTPHRKLNGPELWFEKATTSSFYCRFFAGLAAWKDYMKGSTLIPYKVR